MASYIKLKRGDTLDLAIPIFEDVHNTLPADLTGCTARLQLRTSDGTLAADAAVDGSISVTAYPGQINAQISATKTATFIPGTDLYFDAELTFPDGYVASTETKRIQVGADQTL